MHEFWRMNLAMAHDGVGAKGGPKPSLQSKRFRLWLDQLFEESGLDPHGYRSQRIVRETLFGDALKATSFSSYLRDDGTAKQAQAGTIEMAVDAFERATGKRVDSRFFNEPALGDAPRYRDHFVDAQPRPDARDTHESEPVAAPELPAIRALRYVAGKNATPVEMFALVAAMARNHLTNPSDEVLDILWREAVRPERSDANARDRDFNAQAALELRRAGVSARGREPPAAGAKPRAARKKGA